MARDWFTGAAVVAVVLVIAVAGGYALMKAGFNFGVADEQRPVPDEIMMELQQSPPTRIATEPAPGSRVSATLDARFSKDDASYLFVCRGVGFEPTAYTWDFGDGSPQLLSTNGDIAYHYEKPGRYGVTCSAADEANMAEATAIAIVE